MKLITYLLLAIVLHFNANAIPLNQTAFFEKDGAPLSTKSTITQLNHKANAAALLPELEIITGNVNTDICAGSQIVVPFTAVGFSLSPHTFEAFLSDANGSFTTSVKLGKVVKNGSGVIIATIPSGTPYGTGYRIRVSSVTPKIIGKINNAPISISAVFAKISVLNQLDCFDDCNAVLKAIKLSGLAPLTVLWSNGNTTNVTNPLCAGTYTLTVTNAAGCTVTAFKFMGQPTEINAQYTKTNISSSTASDGSIVWLTSGGVAPYSYLWNNGSTVGDRQGIAKGTYTIKITDANGCSKTVTEVWGINSFTNKLLYTTQLHIHGWSNHNGSPKPGSLQYHNKQADSVGVKVLWWSEHHGIYKPTQLNLPFLGGTINPTTLDIDNIQSSYDAIPDQWQCTIKEGTCTAFIKTDTLALSIVSLAGNSSNKTFSYSPKNKNDVISNSDFVKPLASRPVFQFQLKPTFTASNTSIQFVFRLSWHLRANEQQDVITYKIVSANQSSSVTTNGKDSVTVVMPVQNNWQQVQFDLAAAATYLDRGIDNAISDIDMQLVANNGSIMTAEFASFKLIPFENSTDTIVKAEKQELALNNSIYKVKNILGVEYSGPQHLNGFFPDSVNNIDIFRGKISGNVVNWVQNVHQQGGIVSYNHPFGTGWDINTIPMQDYRVDTMATHILTNQANQCDILEIGYYKRGGADLNHHLLLWDKLTANGLFLYGNGVSDAHGSMWMDKTDLFHTFIYSSDSSDYELLHALSLGKMYFGNQKYFNSRFYYSIGNLEMGDRGSANVTGIKPVINLNPFPPKCKIKMTQVLLNNSLQLTYLHNQTIIDTAAMPILDLSQPCFVRFAVYDSLDYPLAFGQPIVILGLVPQKQMQQKDSIGVEITTFPNPANEHLNLELDFIKRGNYAINLFDANGSIVLPIDERYFYLGKYGYLLDTKYLAPGNYILNVVGEGKLYSRKVIIL